MDFDEIQTVIVNAHLSERLTSDNNSYCWKLKPAQHELIHDLMDRYINPKSPEWLESHFWGEPCAIFFFKYFLKQQPNGPSSIQIIDFYKDLRDFVRAETDLDRNRHARDILGQYFTEDVKQSEDIVEKPVESIEIQQENAFIGFAGDEMKLIQEILEDPEHTNVNDLRSIMTRIEEDVWNVHFPLFIETEHFVHFIQLYEYSRRKVQARHFSKIRIVGKGAFGAVYAVEKLDTHKIYAWKQMDKRKLKYDKSFDVALNELKRLSEIKSPFVTRLKYSLETDDAVVVIMDFYSGGDLKYHMKYSSPDRRKKPFYPEVAKFFAAEMVLALEDMHNLGIIYRDLKPANVLLDEHGHLFISDLGLAKKLLKERPYSTGLSGTPGYWSPEVLCRTPYCVWVDWWSFGVVLYELLCGKRPQCNCQKGSKEWCTFSDRKESEENALSDDGVYAQDLHFNQKYFSPEAEDLIRSLLAPDKTKRLGYTSSEEVKLHPFFEGIDWEAMYAKKIDPPFVPAKRGINAKSIAEVGDFDSRDYRRLKITTDDEKSLAQFRYQDPRIVQRELVDVLENHLGKDGEFTETEFLAGEQEDDAQTSICCSIS